jgi:hypothetical protein
MPSNIRLPAVCYHGVQNLLSSRLLSKNVKIKIYKTIILPVVLYECKTWSLTLREEHTVRVFEDRVLRRIFGPKRDEVRGDWKKLRTFHKILYYKGIQVKGDGMGGGEKKCLQNFG